MRSIALGSSGAEVSCMCLGTMYFGTKQDEQTSFEILDAYFDAGGSFLDTANIYAHWIPGFTGGESETVIGRWMKTRGARSKVFLATKIGFEMPGSARGLNAKQVVQETEKCLKRLDVEKIDLLYAHVDDFPTPLEETLGAYERLTSAGKIRFCGASNFLAWRIAEALCVSKCNGWSGYCCIQQRFTYYKLNPGFSTAPQVVANDDLFDFCRKKDVRMLAYSALLQGAYSRAEQDIPHGYAGTGNEKRKQVLFDMAKSKEVTTNQLVLSWMMHQDPAIIPLVAASSPKMLTENLGALEIRLSLEDVERLNRA